MRLGDLEVPIPDDWEDRSLYTFIAPPEKTVPLRATKSTFRSNVVLQKRRLGHDETLESCTEAIVAQTKAGYGDVEVAVEAGPAAPRVSSNRVSYRLVDPVTHQPVAQLVYVCLVDRAEWQIAVSVPAMDLAAATRRFDEIVEKIRVVE